MHLDHDHDHDHGDGAHAHGHEMVDARPVSSQDSAERPQANLADLGRAVLYVDCFAGASGDMLLGALVDAGLSLDALQSELDKLDLAGYELEARRVQNHGLAGTRFSVLDVPPEGLEPAYPARHLSDIRHLVQSSALSESVKAKSIAVVERLGRVEASIHGVPLESVHFHEIGAVDTIVDVVGFAAGLEILGVERVYSSPIPLGSGAIQTAHGRLPAPAPATLALLASARAPTVPHPAQTEIVTPTGAALLSQLATFARPSMRVRAVGYGFGQKEFPWANGLRVWLGEPVLGSSTAGPALMHIEPHGHSHELYGHDQVVKLECNLDDSTGETLGYTMERLLESGALDVWFTPIQMKKNRPAVLLSVLSPQDRVDDLAALVMHETSTLGVRLFSPAHRLKADRRTREASTPWGIVRVKEKWLGDRCLAVSPEYEDCARIARVSGVSLVDVMNAARQSAEAGVRESAGLED
jgi:uncharacterized protein (TIGR00299 family) protein